MWVFSISINVFYQELPGFFVHSYPTRRQPWQPSHKLPWQPSLSEKHLSSAASLSPRVMHLRCRFSTGKSVRFRWFVVVRIFLTMHHILKIYLHFLSWDVYCSWVLRNEVKDLLVTVCHFQETRATTIYFSLARLEDFFLPSSFISLL